MTVPTARGAHAPPTAEDGGARGRSLRSALTYGRRPGPWVRVLAAGTAGLLLLAPFVLDAYQISMLSRIGVFGLLAISATLLTGISGLPTLGQAAYFGVGAYTAAIVAKNVTAVGPVQLLAAAAMAAVVALLTGTLAARARGVPFLMITLAIGEIAHSAAISWEGITSGTDGLSGIPRVVPFPGAAELRLDGFVYYYALAVCAVLYLLVRALVRSPIGLVMRGLRDNESRLRAVGYASGGYVLLSITLAGTVAGAAGGLLVSVQRFVSPGDMGFSVAAVALLAAIIGGVGSLPGAVLGAALVVLARDYVGARLGGHGPTLVGAMFVAAVYLLPGGIAAFTGPRWMRRRAAGRAAAQPGAPEGGVPEAGVPEDDVPHAPEGGIR